MGRRAAAPVSTGTPVCAARHVSHTRSVSHERPSSTRRYRFQPEAGRHRAAVARRPAAGGASDLRQLHLGLCAGQALPAGRAARAGFGRAGYLGRGHQLLLVAVLRAPGGRPDLAAQEVQLFLLNPRWVRGFKKCFAPDDKTDAKDPFYIAERTRTRRPPVPWQPQTEWWPLRFYTRLRFHLAQALTREKNFAHVYLFLRCSAYHRTRPFSDTFGAPSRRVLTALPALPALTAQPLAERANLLDGWSGHHLPDPLDNARKLQQAAAESFPLEAALAEPVQRVLDLTLQHIADLEALIAQVEQWIADEVQAHHPEVLNLAGILGIVRVLASGIAAEIGDLSRFFHGQKWDKKRQRFRAKNLRDVEDAVAKLAGLCWPPADSGDFGAQERRMAKTGHRSVRD